MIFQQYSTDSLTWFCSEQPSNYSVVISSVMAHTQAFTLRLIVLDGGYTVYLGYCGVMINCGAFFNLFPRHLPP